ncbi:MAG: SDR family oxidoreductase [Bacteroidota bacterium]|nr:SDR family oxidoreductase [Bacteroidota bacterium]
MFKDKVIAITGGSEGIGKALTKEFLSRGAKVATCGRNKAKLDSLAASCASPLLLTLVADVSKQEDCKRFIEETIKKFDGIDILINNAGISMRTLFKDTDLATLKNVMDINFWGSVYCTKYALDSIIKRQGSIVAVSSIAGYRGLPGRSGYSASKYALTGWMEALRTELLETGVNVMWVCPGFTASNIRNVALNASAEPQGESPMDESKMMSAEECARHVIDAIEKRQRTLILTFTGKRTVFMNKFFPSWSDKLVRKFFFKNGELVK